MKYGNDLLGRVAGYLFKPTKAILKSQGTMVLSAISRVGYGRKLTNQYFKQKCPFYLKNDSKGMKNTHFYE